jgi:hypothetical protein
VILALIFRKVVGYERIKARKGALDGFRRHHVFSLRHRGDGRRHQRLHDAAGQGRALSRRRLRDRGGGVRAGLPRAATAAEAATAS